MIKLDVSLDARSYPIQIGTDLLQHMEQLLPCLKVKRVFIVTNTTVAPLYLPQLEMALAAQGITFHSVILPDGEQFKNWVTLNTIYDALLKYRCERSTLLLALGGGVVGDMAGFAAATYQRGMPFVQLPTTLLAQVDSSVGGKTAINHPLGKNMIGAFYQPCAVLVDIATLRTLPQRELIAGMAEVIKYGLIHDRIFFEWLEQHMAALLARDEILLAQAVHRSCAIKAQIVAADETEQGVRALLNLGHTFGHAIETGLGYGEWLHGEAVAAGTMMAVELSARLGLLPQDAVDRIEALFVRAGLPVNGPDLTAEEYLRLMVNDKKVLHGRLRLVLLREIGEAVLFSDAGQAQIVAAIRARTR